MGLGDVALLALLAHLYQANLGAQLAVMAVPIVPVEAAVILDITALHLAATFVNEQPISFPRLFQL